MLFSPQFHSKTFLVIYLKKKSQKKFKKVKIKTKNVLPCSVLKHKY